MGRLALDAETVLSYFLISAGAALFLPLTLTQILTGPDRNLRGGALISLFLIVIGLCMGILSSPLDRDPIFILREFLGLSYDVSTLVRTFSLLLVLSILVYLVVLLYTTKTELLLKVFSALGAACAALVLVFLAIHDTQAAVVVSEALALHGATLVVNACVTGYSLFCLSLPADEDLLGRLSWPVAVLRIVLATEALVSLTFVLSNILVGGLAFGPEPAARWTCLALWFLFLAAGVGGGIWSLRRLRKRPDARPEKRTVTSAAIIALICSFIVNGMLQALVS